MFDLTCFHMETRLIIQTRYFIGAIQFIKSSFPNTMRKQPADYSCLFSSFALCFASWSPFIVTFLGHAHDCFSHIFFFLLSTLCRQIPAVHTPALPIRPQGTHSQDSRLINCDFYLCRMQEANSSLVCCWYNPTRFCILL